MRNVLSVLAFLLTSITLHAASHTDLYPLLIDIKGWKAEAPIGSSMEGVMTTATKTYTKGDASLTVAIIKNHMKGQGMKEMQNVQVDSDTASSKIETINGHKVTTAFDKKDKVGSYAVIFEDNAMLTMSSEKVELKDAIEILKQFDWNKIKKALK